MVTTSALTYRWWPGGAMLYSLPAGPASRRVPASGRITIPVAEPLSEMTALRSLDAEALSAIHARYFPELYRYAAYRTGDDAPTMDSVTPDTILQGTNCLTLWAAGVTAMDGVSNVTCLITPPDYDGISDLVQITLPWQAGTARLSARSRTANSAN